MSLELRVVSKAGGYFDPKAGYMVEKGFPKARMSEPCFVGKRATHCLL